MTAPYPYQQEDAARVSCLRGRALVASEPGTGKTFTALLYLAGHPNRLPAVVVCPASVKYGWQREAAMHLGLRAEVLESTRPPRSWGVGGQPPLAILNYEILGAWLPLLKQGSTLATVVLDESHYIGALEARRTGWCRTLCDGVKRVVALSGTPLTNRPAELWPTLNILRPDLFPAFQPFGMAYCGPKKEYGKWVFKGAENLKALHRLLQRHVMIRRRKEDVLPFLPPKTRIPLAVTVETGMDEYAAARDATARWLLSTNYGRADALVRLGEMKRILGEVKLPEIIRWIKGHFKESTGKLVVFAIHRKVVRTIYEAFKKRALYIDGSVTGRRRQEAVDLFRSKKNIDLCVANMKAAGVGLNGLQVAGTSLFAELAWNPGTHTQAEDRLHRIGSQSAVRAYYMVVRGTFEERLLELIERKQRHISDILDGQARAGIDWQVFSQLVEELRTGAVL